MSQLHVVNYVLLAAPSGGDAINTFFVSPLGKIIGAVMAVVGVAVIIFAVVKAIKDIAGGKVAAAIRTIILAMIFAAFLFDTGLIATVVNGVTKVASGIVDQFTTATNTGTSTGQ